MADEVKELWEDDALVEVVREGYRAGMVEAHGACGKTPDECTHAHGGLDGCCFALEREGVRATLCVAVNGGMGEG